MQSKFTIPANAHDIHVDGRFAAKGGMGNDVEVFLLDEDGFVNWRNGHPSRTYYDSNKTTVGNIAVRLPDTDAPVTYYMIFSNTFSLLSGKVVEANLTLNYQR